MEKDDTIYLRHILDAINIIGEYLRGVKESQFKSTHLLQDGVIRQTEIIGEAVRHVSYVCAEPILKSPGKILQG